MLILTPVNWAIVLFGATLNVTEVDTGNVIVELTLTADDVKVTVLDMTTEVDIFDILVGGALVAVGVGVGVNPIPPAALLTLRLATFFCVPDMTCQPTTGKPNRALMVPSCESVSSLEKAASSSLNAPHPMFHVSKLLDPLANLPSPTPAAITARLSSCSVIG